RSRPVYFRIRWAIIFMAVFLLQFAGRCQNLELLTNATQVLKLTPREAVRGYPVRVRGVVTYSFPAWKFAVVQDETGGVAFNLENEPYPERGDLVEVRGTSGPGVFAPAITLLNISF